jgi:hypothetical protein
MVIANLCQFRKQRRTAQVILMKNNPIQSSDADIGRRSIKLLLMGACAGVLLGGLAAAGKLGGGPLSDSIVATVNGVPLAAAEYRRALSVFGSEKREVVNNADRALVLERMIEEELLLQQGVASGVIRGHNKAREEALKSILAGLVIELESSGSDPEEIPINFAAEDNAKASAASRRAAHDALLAEYLDGLKATSSIRWVGAEFR